MSGCCVYGCSNRYSQDGPKFYRIPRGDRPFQSHRRRLWLQAIKRVDWTQETIKNARVCGAHFISGEASLDWLNPDFVPSVFVYTKIQKPEAKLERYQKKRRRDDGAHKSPDQPSLGSETPEKQHESNMEHGPDVQQLMVTKEEENWSPSPDQEDQKPPQIKEEQEENEITESPFNPVPVKSEDDDEEKPQLPELHHSQTEESKDLVGPEPDQYLESDVEDKTSDSSSETDVSDGNWEETSEAQSGLKSGTNNTDPVSGKAKHLHRCSECSKIFSQRRYLLEHNRIYTGEKPISCSVCDKTFASKTNLNQIPSPDQEDQKPPQIKEEQEENEITESPINPVSVKSEDDEEKPQLPELHHSQTEENKDFVGPEPDQYLESVVEDKTSDSSSETDVSDGNWEETSEAQSGLKSGTNNTDPVSEKDKQLHRCSECSKIFSRRQYLLEHNRIHTGEKPFCCSVCDKTFTWKQSLTLHLRTHSEEKPFICPVCSKTFISKGNFKEHKKVHIQHRPFKCSVCNTAFKRKKTLTEHRRIHTGEKPFSCSICDKTFKWKQSLAIHMSRHSEEKPFSCSDCDKTFISKSNLKKHTQIHAEERPYICSVCNAGFKTKDVLIQHTKTHSMERPFSCSLCGQSFKCRSHLSYHMSRHTGEKPYSCSVCNAAFQRKGTLVVHTRVHTGEKPYSCSVCKETFKWLKTFKNHMRIHTAQ